MEQVISKEELDELMKLEGELKGDGMKSYAEFILKEEGKEGLKKLEDEIAKLGHPIKYKGIKTMGFYPLWLDALTLVAIKRLFNYDDKKFQKMGELGPKTSLFMRLFMKYFFSPETVIKEAPEMWKRYFTVGDPKIIEYDKEKKYMIERIEDFRGHPLQCQYYKGYLSSVAQMVTGSEATCEETKCVHRGDEYHEFLVKW